MVRGCPVPRVCLVMALCLVAVACTHWRDSYFEDGVGQVSHADVEKKFGEPHKTRESALGPANARFRGMLIWPTTKQYSYCPEPAGCWSENRTCKWVREILYLYRRVQSTHTFL